MQTGGLNLTGVNHVVYAVKNMERAKRFYTEILGLTEVPTAVDADHIAWFMCGSGTMVHLVVSDVAPVPRPIHVAFEVDDLDSAMESLVANGVTIIRGPGERSDGQRFIFFHDPEGNLVEICTAGMTTTDFRK